MPVVYSRCSKCGAEVKTRVSKQFAKFLQGAKEAICSDCDPKSSWRKIERR